MRDESAADVRQTFTAARLHMSDIPGSAQILPGTGTAMQVSISGPAELTGKIVCEQRGDTLHISGPRTGAGGVTITSFGRGGSQMNVISAGRNVVISGGGRMVISGDVIMAGGKVITSGDVTVADSAGVRITVSVPLHTPVAIDDSTAGRYGVGDIEGTLDLRLKGGGDVTAGRCADTRVSIQGSSDVEISAVHGSVLSAGIQGSGNVTVRGGQVGRLDLTVQGSGDAVYGGSAQHASLSVMGSGDIRVNEVTGTLDDRCMGSGRIRVHAPPRRDPGTFWDSGR